MCLCCGVGCARVVVVVRVLVVAGCNWSGLLYRSNKTTANIEQTHFGCCWWCRWFVFLCFVCVFCFCVCYWGLCLGVFSLWLECCVDRCCFLCCVGCVVLLGFVCVVVGGVVVVVGCCE